MNEQTRPTASDVRDSLREYFQAKTQHDSAFRDFQRTEVSERLQRADQRLKELIEGIQGEINRSPSIFETNESYRVRHLVMAYGEQLFTQQSGPSPKTNLSHGS